MSAFFDIYCLSNGRNEATVERFLQYFCYREHLEPLPEMWIQVSPSEKYYVPEVELPLNSIAEMIDYAVRNPTHCFSFYSKDALRNDLKTVIIKFTYDGKVVFGISIEEWGNFPRARLLEAEIRIVTEAYKSYISVEYPPANDEEEFYTDVAMWKDIGKNG